ncbi:MAG: transposase [Cyanobacteria bacterium P01_E01_bin.34]
MARTKLTAEARAQIVDGYRQPGVTVSMLAKQFGISSSTASRVLKEDIPVDEYKQLVKNKRGGRPSKQKQADQPSLLEINAEIVSTKLDSTEQDSSAASKQLDAGSSVMEVHDDASYALDNSESGAETDGAARIDDDSIDDDGVSDEGIDDEDVDDELEDDEQLGAELFGDEDDDSDNEYDSDDEEDEDDDGQWDEQPSQVEVVGPPPVWYSAVQANPDFSAPAQQDPINILALAEEDLPGQCFAVVDRFQELTTCPLQEFNHLGDIPNELAEAKALPLFDSHRVARRFSDRFRHRGRHKHRVIGFPSYFLSTAREQLQEKGITHLLLDNQIYKL